MPRAVVVGSGIAGLFAAVRLAEAGWEVAVVTKARLNDSSTNWAQGGIAAILDTSDASALEQHVQDTLAAGAGRSDEAVVRDVVAASGPRIEDLIDLGVSFDRDPTGDFDLAREGGHAERRILHARDATGAEIERALIHAVHHRSGITVLEGCLAVDLILADREASQRRVVGLWYLDLLDRRMRSLPAEVVLLATGGAGQLFRQTTNPRVATGDGTAMAVRAGAAVRDLEFVQFHPTALALPGERPFLLTEALRGHGAVLMSHSGHARWRDELAAAAANGSAGPAAEAASFMRRHDARGSLATRDVAARAADAEMKRSGESSVLLVTEHLDPEDLAERFPTVAHHCATHGLTLGIDPIPVAPAAHYLVGGLATDAHGRVHQAARPEWSLVERLDDDQLAALRRPGHETDHDRTAQAGHPLTGLYAIGEAACTGLHGANRLASNSLLEAVVFAQRAVEHATANPPDAVADDPPAWRADGLPHLVEHAPVVADRDALQTAMSLDVGLVRSDRRLLRALRRLRLLQQETERLWLDSRPSLDLVELRNLVLVGDLVARAALARRENVGLHWNEDLR